MGKKLKLEDCISAIGCVGDLLSQAQERIECLEAALTRNSNDIDIIVKYLNDSTDFDNYTGILMLKQLLDRGENEYHSKNPNQSDP